MATITVTAASVEAAENAEVIRGTLGAAVTAGQPVYLDSDGTWKPAAASAAASALARGVVVGAGVLGTSYPSGAVVDIVTHGRVLGFSGMTPGGSVYVSATAGALDQTAPSAGGTHTFNIGWAESATALFVSPQSGAATAN